MLMMLLFDCYHPQQTSLSGIAVVAVIRKIGVAKQNRQNRKEKEKMKRKETSYKRS